jgi:hypothetical protein
LVYVVSVKFVSLVYCTGFLYDSDNYFRISFGTYVSECPP